jgi:hypothetical protein
VTRKSGANPVNFRNIAGRGISTMLIPTMMAMRDAQARGEIIVYDFLPLFFVDRRGTITQTIPFLSRFWFQSQMIDFQNCS